VVIDDVAILDMVILLVVSVVDLVAIAVAEQRAGVAVLQRH
jgi:hypothetical protein